MKTIRIAITGTSPLIMHSDKLSNPLDPATIAHKKLTSKRNRTEENQVAIARSEYENSLYLKNGKVVIPTINLAASIIDGAKLNKKGLAFQRGTMILEEFVALQYDGPRNPGKLFDTPAFVDCRSVVVSRSRLMRYRPRFNSWALEVDVIYDEAQIDRDVILTSAKNAGQFCGLGDFRPNKKGPFGRYAVEEMAA